MTNSRGRTARRALTTTLAASANSGLRLAHNFRLQAADKPCMSEASMPWQSAELSQLKRVEFALPQPPRSQHYLTERSRRYNCFASLIESLSGDLPHHARVERQASTALSIRHF